jgi:endonuclease G
MRVSLSDLQRAAERYTAFCQAQALAPQAVVAAERLKLGLRNAQDFTSSADRLSVISNALKAAQPAPAAETEADVDTAGLPPPPPLLGVAAAGQEIAFGDNDLRPVRYLHVALLAAQAVGKITVRGFVDEEGDATGFLVAPGLLLTNHHVLPAAEFAAASFVSFDMEDGLDGKPKTPKLFDLQPDTLYVSDQELDYCLVAVSPATAQGEPLAQFGFLRLFERTGKVDPNRRQAANIVQHPLGQGKKVALRDNYFMEPPKDRLDTGGHLNSLFYGSDTLKGSSGSPVCTDEWFVVALHRGGVPRMQGSGASAVVLRRDGTPAREGDARSSIDYITNEGTRVSRIYTSLRDKAAAADATAAHAAAALRRLSEQAQDPRLGPVAHATAVLQTPGPLAPDLGDAQEKLIRRKADFFEGATGYRPGFLGAGFEIPLPELSHEVLQAVAPLRDAPGHELRYDNYSVVMHARRRTAVFAAGNVDGRLLWKKVMDGGLPRRPSWTFDPRMDDGYQPDDLIFSNALQRGHLFKREDAVQGEDEAALDRADKHSFVITNATPMIAGFNNVEWGDLEDRITRHLEEGHRVSYFAGPIFDVEDKFFNQLKAGVPAARRRKGMRVPTRFWKIVAWVEDGSLHAAGFVLDQSDEIRAHGPITEEIDFGAYEQTSIEEIELRTGLGFAPLRQADTFAG